MTEQAQLTAQEARSILAKIEDQAATLTSVGISPTAVYLSGFAYDLLAAALFPDGAGFSEGRLVLLGVGAYTLPVLRMPSMAVAHRGDIAVAGLDRRKARRRGSDQSSGLQSYRIKLSYAFGALHVFAADVAERIAEQTSEGIAKRGSELVISPKEEGS